MDLYLDTQSHDLVISDGDLKLAYKDDAVRQHLKQRLYFFRAEWFLDTSAGVPYYQYVLVKNPNMDLLRSAFETEIVETPGMVSLDELEFDYNADLRTLELSFSGKCTDGDVSLTLEL